MSSLPAIPETSTDVDGTVEQTDNKSTPTTTVDLPLKKRKPSADSSHASGEPGSSGSAADTSAMSGPLKKRKASVASSTPSAEGGQADRKSSMDDSEDRSKRKGSADEAERKSSIESEDAARRKASVDSEDPALGLMALGSVASTLSEEQKPTDAGSSNTKGSGTFGNALASSALDHLDALGDDHASLGSKPASLSSRPKDEARPKKDEDGSGGSGGTLASSNQRLLMEALMMTSSRRRDRLESWGGMSDLSVTGMGPDMASSEAAAAFTASALHETGILGDITAAAATSCGASITSEISEDPTHKAVPSGISLPSDRRDRKDSADSLTNLDEASVAGPNIQAFVQAAMLTMGDHLAQLAGAVEMAASAGSIGSFGSDVPRKEAGLDSDVSSGASPLIGATTEKELAALMKHDSGRGRTRSSSTSSKPIAVDYNAVAAAVDAANAASGAIDLNSIGQPASGSLEQNPKIPSKSPAVPPIPPSTMSSEDLEAIRARARAAAGYVPPSEGGSTTAPRPPLKKRPRITAPDVTPSKGPSFMSGRFRSSRRTPPRSIESRVETTATPKTSNASTGKGIRQSSEPHPPLVPSSLVSSAPKAAASNQKWDEMFDCLLQYIEDRKEEDLKDATDKEKEEWVWDGNVATNYKAKDGKALGRWINNQRSAKAKGTLKKEREDKLVSSGLKWCVLVTNSWDDMMKELRIYISEQTKDGRSWNGNVPTSYMVTRASRGEDEDKNLGRWVNRQRSLYQAGKLRKDRQQQLEKIGLKWSVLSTTSWDSMFESLCEYVKECKAADPNNEWDGNVQAKYETKDNPPKALGRWINRQRSSYSKGRLKKEFVDKLTGLGLKWSVHDRRVSPNGVTNSPPDDDEDDENEGEKQREVVSV